MTGRSPDGSGAEDLRRYQLHMRSRGASATSMNAAVSALRYFFGVTLGRGAVTAAMTFVRAPRKLPVVLSPEEVARLREGAPGLKYRAALSARLWGGPARFGGGLAQGLGHRQQPQGDPRRAGQGPQGSLRHALGASPRSFARLVAGGPRARRDATRGLAVSRPEPGQSADHPPAAPRLRWRQGGRRDRQAGLAAHAAPLLCHPPPGAEGRHPRDPGAAGAQEARHGAKRRAAPRATAKSPAPPYGRSRARWSISARDPCRPPRPRHGRHA